MLGYRYNPIIRQRKISREKYFPSRLPGYVAANDPVSGNRTLNGSDVAAIGNLAGAGYGLAQSTPSLQPTLTDPDAGWNGEPTFYLGGEYLNSATGDHAAVIAGQSAFSLYVATEATLTNGAIGYIAKAWKSANTNVRLNVIGYQNATETTVTLTMGVAGGATDTLTTSVVHAGSVPKKLYICCRCDGHGLWLSVNDTTTAGQNDSDATLVDTIATAGATFDYDSFRLGDNASPLPWEGSCGGMWLYNQKHTDANAAAMLAYFATRFGAA